MQEFNFKPVFLDEDAKRSAIKKYFDLITEGARSQGVDINGFGAMETLMAARGFQNIQVKRFKWPLGSWAKGAYNRNIAVMLKQNFSMVLEALALRPLTNLGWSAEEIQVFLAEVREEVREHKVNAYAEM